MLIRAHELFFAALGKRTGAGQSSAPAIRRRQRDDHGARDGADRRVGRLFLQVDVFSKRLFDVVDAEKAKVAVLK